MVHNKNQSTDNSSLREEDIEVLRGLYECRVMTVKQIAAIHFEGRTRTAHHRCQILKEEGFVRERARKPVEPSILFLGFKGFEYLNSTGALDHLPRMPWPIFSRRVQVSKFSLDHEIDVLNIKATLLPAIESTEGFRVSEFSTWPRLYQFYAHKSVSTGGSSQRKRILTKPDGFLRIEETTSLSEQTFFIEVDRSTENLETIVQKAVAYTNHYRSGGFAESQGFDRERPEKAPFRVLMIFKNAERRNNVAERLLQNDPPIHSIIWLSTFEEIAEDPLGEIWIRPVDFRDATRGTEFDVARGHTGSRKYRRNPTRERHVESCIKKCALC